MAGYLVSDEDLKRLSAVLMDYERGVLSRVKVPEEFAGQLPVMQIVKVTGSASGTNYPAALQEYNETTGTWTDLETIIVREVNGAALTIGQRYIGRYAGDISSGAIYMVLAGGGGGGSILSLDFITSISCVNGVITPVYSTVCIPGAYICTTTTTTTTAAPTSSTSTSSTSSSTTSTTTTCDTGIGGYVVIQWTGSVWTIISNNCMTGYTQPELPSTPGDPGETRVICCVPG